MLAHHLLALVYVALSVAWPVWAEDPLEVLEGASSPTPGTSWQCQRPGRFINPEDPSCRTYFTCIPDGPSRFTLRQDECGASALFSGRYQRCITGSDCATLEDFYAIEYECNECGKFLLPGATDCRQFVNCLKTKDPGVFIPIRQSCPVGRLFSIEAHSCIPEEEFECPPTTIATTTEMPVTPIGMLALTEDGGHLSEFVCLGPGRFPDESVPHCRGYRLCQESDVPRETRLVSRSFLCNPEQVFSEPEQRCVPAGSYQCPDDDAAERFRCEDVGRFPDRSALGCERYFHCQRTATGTLRATLVQCPIPGTVFSWLTTRCVPSAEYVCPVAAIGGVEVPAEVPSVEVEEQVIVVRNRTHRTSRCSNSGRFANDADPLCRTYFLCTRDVRGAWERVLLQCPVGSLFSRTVGNCVGSETEPGRAEQCTPQTRTTTVEPAVKLSLEPDESYDDSDEESEMECDDPSQTLPNPSDRTCQSYFKCRRDDQGHHRLRLLRCPEGTRFLTSASHCVEVTNADVQEYTLYDGSGEPSFCAESSLDPGSGESLESADQLLLVTSTVSAITRQVKSSTELPVTRTHTPERAKTPETTADEETGGSFSYTGPVPEYPCSATGRFADINSVDCRSYFLCRLQQPSGSLVSVHLTCPDGMVFSRNVNKCIVSNRHVC